MKKAKKFKKNFIKRNLKEKDCQIVEGIIHVHPKGFAFVTPDDPSIKKDIFIPKHLKENAIDGDRVEIAIDLTRKSVKGKEGLVRKVIERGKKQLVGIVWIINPKGHYILYVQSLGNTKSAIVKNNTKEKYSIGDRLLLKIIDWGEENDPLSCEVIEKIGSIFDPFTDIPSAIKDFDIRDAFPKQVIKEADQFPKTVEKTDLKDRLDLTDLETFTIDPKTARDFDDALSLNQDEKGHYHLGVHIADVSHYVRSGSHLDTEALKRCNSTYFPSKCIPMLPENLSNHLCSLKEKVIRLCLSVLMELDQEGNLLHYEIKKSFIESRKRFTYEEAKEVLDKKTKSPHFAALKLMEKLCLLLKQKRFDRGSVDLALPEISLLIDENGKPYDFEVIEYDITHQLVEEFMLKANEIVAYDFTSKNLPSVYRIHETPSAETLEDFYSLARLMGFPLPDKPTPQDVQKLFSLAKDTSHAHQLSVAFIRSMKLAIYSQSNVGHYGLALENYCHFTSPIRRYSDLIIHRLLFDKEIPNNLEKISQTCSEKERISFKAEMNVLTLKKLRLLKEYQKKDPKRIYSAVITKVKPFGFFFEVAPLKIVGYIHVSDLGDDYYEFLPDTNVLVGKRSHKSIAMGNRLDLMLDEIDLIQMEAKWAIQRRKKKS